MCATWKEVFKPTNESQVTSKTREYVNEKKKLESVSKK